jgi:putative Mg2+ transporter-C (MgtC) family protein
MTTFSFMDALGGPAILLPLFGSLIAGALIGAERELSGKPAGLRTHTLVCFSSALLTLVALLMGEWTTDLPSGTQIVSDMARMPHAILTGIGFLCAGVIFREGVSVHGLTTAASLWLTAALGITFGTGLLELGAIGTVIALLVLMLLRLVRGLAPLRLEFNLDVTVQQDSALDAAALRSLLTQSGVIVGPLGLRQDRDAGRRHYRMLVTIADRKQEIETLANLIGRDRSVIEVSFAPLDL